MKKEDENNLDVLNQGQVIKGMKFNISVLMFYSVFVTFFCLLLGASLYREIKFRPHFVSTPIGGFPVEMVQGNPLVRQDFEIDFFADFFLRKAFENDKNTYTKNFNQIVFDIGSKEAVNSFLEGRVVATAIRWFEAGYRGEVHIEKVLVNVTGNAKAYNCLLQFNFSAKKGDETGLNETLYLYLEMIPTRRSKQNPLGLKVDEIHLLDEDEAKELVKEN